MAHILFLDDSPARWRVLFNHAGRTHQILWAQTAADAISYLKDPSLSFDLVMLDHDLLDEHYENCYEDYGPGTGMDVVDWVIANPERFHDTPFTIHSLNTMRAHEMKARLEDAQFASFYIPFGWKEEAFGFLMAWFEGVFSRYQRPASRA